MMRVLIVDDNPLMRQMLREWIAAEGAGVMEATSAEDALIVVSAHGAPAAAICDIHLPGKDGIWLAERLHEECPQTAVITTTASRDFDLALSSFHAGAVDHLVYPFTFERLAEALRRVRFAHMTRRGLADMQKEVERLRAQLVAGLGELEITVTGFLEAMLVLRPSAESDALDKARRIAQLAVKLALTLQIGEPQLSAIERAVFLQDSASLPTYAERRSLAILRNIPLLAAASDIALAAHERYDGSGFPLGLRGDDVPLSARIMAVAAAYDELASGLHLDLTTPVAVVEILCSEGASRFDPLVLDALRKLQPTPSVLPQSEGAGSDLVRMLTTRTTRADQPEYARRVADAVLVPEDPRRRWMRKRLAAAVPAEIGGSRARVVDVSYGGFRIETPASLKPTLAAPFALSIPEYRVHAEATCMWIMPMGVSGPYVCGAAVSDKEMLAGSRWRALVDVLPTQPPTNSEWN